MYSEKELLDLAKKSCEDNGFECVYVTEDGQCFQREDDASNHARNQDFEKPIRYPEASLEEEVAPDQELLESLSELKEELAEKQAVLEGLQESEKTLRESVTSLEADLKASQSNVDTLTSELEESEAANKELQEKFDHASARIVELESAAEQNGQEAGQTDKKSSSKGK